MLLYPLDYRKGLKNDAGEMFYAILTEGFPTQRMQASDAARGITGALTAKAPERRLGLHWPSDAARGAADVMAHEFFR